MARTLSFTGEIQWPLEDGKQAAKINLAASLVYASALHIEKVYSAVVTDEVVTLPMASAKFLLLQAITNDITVKLNASTDAITIKAGTGFILIFGDGVITALKVSTGTVPATLKGMAFA